MAAVTANVWRRSTLVVAAWCVLLTAVWDQLFWDWPLGVSAAVYAAVIGAVLVVRSPALWRQGQGRLIIAAALLVTLALVEQPSLLAILMTLVIFGTLVLISQRDLSLFQDTVTAWLSRWFVLLATMGLRFLRDNALAARWFARHPRVVARFLPVVKAVGWWVLPLAAGAVFIGLFAIANPVISDFFSRLGDSIQSAFIWMWTLSFLRIFLWLVIAALLYGVLRHRHTWKAGIAAPPVVAQEATWAWLTGPQMIIRLLLVLNAVFLIANALDAAYLYFGVPLPEHMDYRDYARRGAHTLIFTAVLAGIITLFAFRQNGTAHRSRICRWLVYLWIGQNIFLLISTIWRLDVFVQTTLLTRLRISTMVWSGLVAMGFVWIILRIKFSKPNAWLWRMNAFTAVTTLLVCSFINFDGIVAAYNVRNCAQSAGTGYGLDISYLDHLGTSSLPALAWIRENPGKFSPEERRNLLELELILRHELEDDLRNWRGWTWRRARSYDGITADAVARLLESMPPAVPTPGSEPNPYSARAENRWRP